MTEVFPTESNLLEVSHCSYHAVIMDARLLLVCAEQDAADLLIRILSEMGLAPEHTPSLSHGMERLDEKQFDAVILDYYPGLACQEFLTRWRKSLKNRNAILIAIVDGEFEARPAFGLGANFVLYRPLSAERARISLRAARGLIRRERRRAPRAPVDAPANVAYPGVGEITANLGDLSEGGTSLLTNERIPKSTKMYFEFVLPSQKRPIRLSGEVAWQDSGGRTGIRFLDVPQTSRRLIQSWLQLQASSPKPAANVPSAPLSTEQKLPALKKDSSLLAQSGNRRGERRFPCRLGAEVYRLGSSVPNRCILSDISEGGCYVEMPSPLSGQSGVEIVVRTSKMKLKIRGQVQAAHPGFGMGVRFMFADSAEREEVLRLLALLAAGPALDEVPR
jgi:c-di-GMP-binding flagellar brake protein YcgR